MRLRALFLLVPALAAGCAGIRLSTEYDRTIGFRDYTTYEWVQDAQEEDASDFDLRVRAEFDRLLAQKGYRKVTANPDLWLHFHAGPRGIDFQSAYRRYGYRPSGNLPVNLDGRPHGADALVLDVIDRASQELVWRGAATRAFDPNDEDRLFVRLELAAEVLLRGYPPVH